MLILQNSAQFCSVRDFGGSAWKVRERGTVWSFYEVGREDGDSELSAPQSGIRERNKNRVLIKGKGREAVHTPFSRCLRLSVGGPADFIG